MIFNNSKKLLLILISAILMPIFLILAQEQTSVPSFDSSICESPEKIDASCQSLSRDDCQKVLENCEKYLEEKAGQIDADITKTQKDKKTLQNQISLLKKKIEKLDLQIYQSNLVIKDIKGQIVDTEGSINKTGLEIEDSKQKLADILRIIYKEDQASFLEIMLAEDRISDFFNHLVALDALNLKTKELLMNIESLKTSLEDQKQSLEGEKGDLENVVKIQTLQKKESESTKKEQDSHLKLTETQYQKQLKEKEETQKRRAEIRARIFDLIGIPEAPTFGEALEIAKYVEKFTNVRPAFLLAILTQESNLGKNVGQCYLTDFESGGGVIIKSGQAVSRVMKPSRDVPPFLTITQELGRDSKKTPVSCPMQYGYGGAMGPAQFIPSTWSLYREKIKTITGKAGDPWNIKDAFLAAGLYLSDYGAAKQTDDSEWRSAMIYFSGSTNTKFRFYGDSVMRITSQYEQDIKDMENGG